MQDPVCTPDGYLFSKEAIVENLLQQKKMIKRKLAAWESQQASDQQKVSHHMHCCLESHSCMHLSISLCSMSQEQMDMSLELCNGSMHGNM